MHVGNSTLHCGNYSSHPGLYSQTCRWTQILLRPLVLRWLLAFRVHTVHQYVWHWSGPDYKRLPACQGSHSRTNPSAFISCCMKRVAHMEVSDSQRCVMMPNLRTFWWLKMSQLVSKGVYTGKDSTISDTVRSADWGKTMMLGAVLIKSNAFTTSQSFTKVVILSMNNPKIALNIDIAFIFQHFEKEIFLLHKRSCLNHLD